MKIIEVDDELYHYIASKTEKIGEPASAILRRLLGFDALEETSAPEIEQAPIEQGVEKVAEKVVESVVGQSAELSVEQAAEQSPIEPVTAASQEQSKPEPEAKVEPVVQTESTKPAVKEKKPRKIPPRKLSAKEQQEADEVAQLAPSAMFNRLNLADLDVQHGAVGRFLYVLSALEAEHKETFTGVVKIKGRDRLYFADNQEALVESGSSTNPKRIGETSFWVITNNNTSRKKWMLSEVAKMLGYNDNDLRILAAKI